MEGKEYTKTGVLKHLDIFRHLSHIGAKKKSEFQAKNMAQNNSLKS